MKEILKKIVFFSLLLIFAVTFFTKNNYKNVDDINPEVLKEPFQIELGEKNTFTFQKDEYEYEVTPLYYYELSGLVVHKMNYTLFSIYKMDSVFPADFCMIWGDNVKNKIYKDKSLKFSQDMRFCFAQWSGKINFNIENLSNNHLLTGNKDLMKKIKSVSAGDQVKIKGELVNVKAKNLESEGKYDPKYSEWSSSTTREDTGAGACEVIYLEDIEILKKGNIISHELNKISFYGLIIYIILGVAFFIVESLVPKKYENEE